MKTLKKLLAASIAIIMLFCTVGMALTASAATKDLQSGKTVKVTSNGYYKISVPGEGCITLTAKASASGYDSVGADIELLNSKKNSFVEGSYDDDISLFAWGETESETIKAAVSKGTYLVKVTDFSKDGSGKLTISYTYQKITQPTNYTIGRSAAVASGKKVMIYQTQQNNFDRWYKIKLTSNKKISVFTSESASYEIGLYDSEGNEMKLSSANIKEGHKSVSTKLAKGTYFVCIDKVSGVNKTEINSFKWQ